MRPSRPGGQGPAARAIAHAHVRAEDFESSFHQAPDDKRTPGRTWTAAVAVPPADWPAWTDAPFDRVALALAHEEGVHVG